MSARAERLTTMRTRSIARTAAEKLKSRRTDCDFSGNLTILLIWFSTIRTKFVFSVGTI